MNKKLFLSLSTVLFLSTTGKAQVTTDSIKKELELEEVVVLAPNMERMNNYILIRPDSKQRKHSKQNCHLIARASLYGVGKQLRSVVHVSTFIVTPYQSNNESSV